ncbi:MULTISPECIES: VanZ family protein [Gammaproteobacteria]|uniref:VanZ family protein n=1 Tax=Gammaproteobacteria TaxID=1236 RepID=UPI000DCF6DE3|nr:MULTISPECIES: VanZ family protein [Gammaproteobacteria]RTE85550.1 hypothetical protein DQX04_11665 [Aliidiomarina sp. B3213]TCZ89520.1 hypothetical protein EYQ95_11595 [Lysobacter sp. N42]
MQKLIEFLRRKGRVLFVLSVVVASIGLLSQVPSDLTPRSIPMYDKIAHVILFFGLATTLHFAFSPRVWLAFVILGIYGGAVEWVQYYIPGRGAEWVDFLADMVGVALFYGVRAAWYAVLSRQPETKSRG